MKITGYTIIYFLLSILLIYGFIQFEIYFYETSYLTGKDKAGFIGINCFIFVIIIVVLWLTDVLKPLDKLLKKRIL